VGAELVWFLHSIQHIDRAYFMNEEIIQNLNERLDRTIERGRDILADEQLQQQVEELKSKAEDTIRRHPIKSVLAGLAVGILLGAIIGSDD